MAPIPPIARRAPAQPWRASICLAVLAVAALGRAEDLGGEFREVTTRPGVTQKFILIRPADRPVASVILFAGGDGILSLSPAGIGSKAGNFVVRNRQRFADQGFLVAVVDVPSDLGKLSDGFRSTAEHADDMKVVIAALRAIADVPVWLVGTSRGTISAANVAARLQSGGANGLVLTSTLVAGRGETVYHVKLADIRIPTLVVHHRHDGCNATPYGAVSWLMSRLKGAPRTELLTFDGGDPPRSGPCEPFAAHGYVGIDAEVVKAIAGWIRAAAAST